MSDKPIPELWEKIYAALKPLAEKEGASFQFARDKCALIEEVGELRARVRELEQSAEWERVAPGAAIQERDAALDKRDELQARNQELESALRDADATLAPCNCLCDVTRTREIIRAALAHKPSPEVKP